MRRWIARIGTAGMALCLLGLWLPASPASAEKSKSGYYEGIGTQAQAGYLAPSPTNPEVVDQFTVPTVSCASAPNSGLAFGVSLINESTNEPFGAGVVALCSGGTPTYHAMFNQGSFITFTGFTPAPGDIILATAKAALSTTTVLTMTVQDVTQNQTQSHHQCCASIGAFPYAFWGVTTVSAKDNGAPLPVPTFTSVRFTDSSLTGATVSASGGIPYNLKESTVVDIRTGALNSIGRAFSETFKDNG